ncbi:PREDICTED: polycomb protein suz12-B-like isoform X3 [Amphimedon queenslandica]|uniref:Polycomb protein VEFS-Box domain-containing protein n=1 Tax=Amphimedon queenslandica TaxID=400682 RepID=A0AAN0J9R0_AMPQE|nr:PREDICTED: polycomb protein suz12-B-like isoform X3 [Amphimedon queenslandica]|eukprot:XP_019853749.1 PREDICTED: polycomb protein suz12-B-like isoform X3 [Amphimedon queenslandica]
MAEGNLEQTMDTDLRIKNDHELFLEAYEKPTQIYRFLRSRHLLEPIFLQRNLSYMKRSRTKPKRRNMLKLNDLAKQTKEVKKDIAEEIKSDNQLKITFQALDCSTSSSTIEGEHKPMSFDKRPMGVEVMLYKFKQPSPEILLTTPCSLPCDCISLGKCVIPGTGTRASSAASSSNRNSITVPGSVLSWREIDHGPVGTHVLAFRIVPLTNDDNLVSSLDKKKSRKRPLNTGLSSGIDSHDSVTPSINGCIHIEENEQQSVPREEIKDKILNKKVPGGTTLPSLTATTRDSNLVISISRNPNEATDSSPTAPPKTNGSSCRIRRNELQLLVDNSTNSLTSSSCLPSSLQPVENETCSRKRPHSETSPSPLNPSKKHCTSSSIDNDIPSPAGDLPPLSSSSSILKEEEEDKYYAELVAFDSRKECLLYDGEYQLHLTKLTPKRKLPTELRVNGMKPSTLFKWGSGIEPANKSYTESVKETVSLKLSIEWNRGPPVPRIEEISNTALDFAKLRENYDELIQSISKRTQSAAVQQQKSADRKTTPTAFNFLYNKNTLQQTELKTDCVCPWCSLNCGELYSLLKHMSLCHPRFLFTYTPIEGGASIDVRINKMYDSPDSLDLSEKDDSILTRKKRPTKCEPFTRLLVKSRGSKGRATHDLKEFMAKRQFVKTEPSRVFYHTHTCLPMLLHEIDSDEDPVPQWLKITSNKMVDEFIDVNQGEKQFMKIWNTFHDG